MKKRILRVSSLILIVLFLLPFAVSCNGRPLAQTSLSGKEVGTIGSYSVQYEEFYYLASNYHNIYKAKYKDDPTGLKDAIWNAINDNIVSEYYTIRALCDKENVECSDWEISSYVDDYVKADIDANFGGDRDTYFASLAEVGLTDHYVRFTIATELLYSRLVEKYKENGTIPSSDEDMLKYMKENLIHTVHIARMVNSGDKRETELSNINKRLESLKNGAEFLSLIKYSEDFYSSTLINTDGIYFRKGEMTKEYEDAALGLKIGEYSDVIVSTADLVEEGQGLLECFYIIKRLPVKESEITQNFDTLSKTVIEAIVAEKAEEIKANLSFNANDYAKSLDVTNLEYPGNGWDYQPIVFIAVTAIVILGIIIAVIAIREVRAKRFRQKQQRKGK